MERCCERCLYILDPDRRDLRSSLGLGLASHRRIPGRGSGTLGGVLGSSVARKAADPGALSGLATDVSFRFAFVLLRVRVALRCAGGTALSLARDPAPRDR